MATTDVRRAGAAQSKAGQSGDGCGREGGRPKGVRARLITEFLSALVEDFTRNGRAAIRKARDRSPVQYLRLIGALVPRGWFGEDEEPAALPVPAPAPVPAMLAKPKHEMVRSPHRLR